MVVLNQAKNTPIFSTAERPLRRLGGKAHGLASSSPKFLDLSLYLSHTIHLWYIYLHLPYKSTKCRYIYQSYRSYGYRLGVGPLPVAVAHVGIPYYKLCNDPGGHC